jgi:hypothetical protein
MPAAASRPSRACAALAALGLGSAGLAWAADDPPPLPPPAALPACPPERPATPPRPRPGADPEPFVPAACDPSRLPPPQGLSAAGLIEGLPDRWRIVDTLGYPQDLWNPYAGNNWLKADRPIPSRYRERGPLRRLEGHAGSDWFLNLTGIADSVVEPRRLPTPRAGPVTDGAGDLDQIGDGEQLVLAQTLALEAVLYQGNTVFMPPEWEFRALPVVNLNYAVAEERGVLKAPASADTSRGDAALGLQAFFVDRHLRDVSDRYDFDSVRIGIQPFTADFRGFLFNDAPLGVRLFGIRDNNRYQYNLGWFRRLEKDTNSGLNDVIGGDLRDEDILVANFYAQDFPRPGFTSQVTALWTRNRDDPAYDDNGFLQRPAPLGIQQPREYDVGYLGYNGDGHFRRFNLSVSAYAALGDEDRSTFNAGGGDIRAFFLAAEASKDFDWIRGRVSFLYASGDDDPFDDRATGYDAVFENPLFAGADTSFWIRQPVPLIGGGRVALSGRNGVLNSLRPSKELGQANFTNPGTILVGVGADLDLTPQLRVSVNANDLWFDDTASLEVARAQAGIDRHLGLDLSAALTWRPLAIQNVVFRLSAAALIPGAGYEDLYGDEWGYSVLGNMVLTY